MLSPGYSQDLTDGALGLSTVEFCLHLLMKLGASDTAWPSACPSSLPRTSTVPAKTAAQTHSISSCLFPRLPKSCSLSHCVQHFPLPFLKLLLVILFSPIFSLTLTGKTGEKTEIIECLCPVENTVFPLFAFNINYHYSA